MKLGIFMNVWIKAVLYVVLGIVLSKLINNFLFASLNTKGGGVNLLIATVAGLLGSAVLAHFVFKATSEVKNKDKIPSAEKEDLSVYAEAISEINSNNRNEGLWAKCYADANGEKFKAEAAYIKVRAKELAKTKEELKEKLKLDNAEYLFRNKMYTTKNYGERKYLLLDNQNVAIIYDGVVHIYICERDFFNAIDIGDLQHRCKLTFNSN